MNNATNISDLAQYDLYSGRYLMSLLRINILW